MESQLTQRLERKPQGFDPGLECLAGVFIWTMAAKFFLPMASHTHDRALVALALLGDYGGMAILLLISLIVWFRRKSTARLPRSWAVLLAIIWSASSLAMWLWLMGSVMTRGQFASTIEIDRETFSLSLPGQWIENTNINRYDPNSLILFKGPRSAVFSLMIRRKSPGTSVDSLIAEQRNAFANRLQNASFTEISDWPGPDSRGLQIDGNVLGVKGQQVALVEQHVTIFGLENDDHVCIVEECANLDDYKEYAGDFETLRQTLKLK